ncbi:phytoene desaturase family protein [Enterococcus sp. CWB-B31]|uniref:phytoene desaturase family protein n=1 Tax=Enterococcus sp. CWB-B31 TaxID=2885159 RepID=UPI001E610B9E|nr:FAD-dependent oxidoreductase [Enterococcus sp. CWB-B31]MCB5953733.1 FAD-dependent oxidoreductase [Enterococcus sp. CWB-B31]
MKKKISVIGGGISGLAAAALMSKENEVIVFEKSDLLGGLCQTITSGTTNYYLGAHHLGGISKSGPIGKILNQLAIDYDETFIETEYLTILLDGKSHQLPVKLSELSVYITENFPDETAVEAFIQKLISYQQAFIVNDDALLLKMFMETSQKSFNQFLSEYFTNELLKKLLLSFGPGYGAVLGEDSAFTVLSLVISYSIGACYVKGGPQKLIHKLEQQIITNGGKIQKNVECLELLVDKETAVTGIRCKELKTETIFEIETDKIISTVFPFNILPESCQKLRNSTKMKKLEKGPSVFRVFAELLEDVLGLSSDNTYLGKDTSPLMKEQLYLAPSSDKLPICMISLPHKADPLFNESKRTIMFTFLLHNHKEKVELVAVLKLIREAMPEVSDKLEAPFALENDDYSKVVSVDEGSVFGWIRTGKSVQNTNSFSPVFKGINGLYICGNWSTDFGVYGAFRSAYKIYTILEENAT